MSDTFDWSTSDDVIIRSYGNIAVYLNDVDDIVIRQRDTLNEEQFVIIPRGELIKFLAKLQSFSG